MRKCLELYEQLEQRMGVVIVGPSCCGKSTVLTVLRHVRLYKTLFIIILLVNLKYLKHAGTSANGTSN